MRISDWSSDVCSSDLIDAHTAAGKSETPVKVWLPDEFDPYFRVTDTGIGMSHEFMMTSFMAYTDGSTKDQSNDQIGGWGIGSKSPFSYTDQFVLVSVHDGVRSVYSVFKDEDSIPRSEEHTSELQSLMRISYAVVCLKQQN